MQRFNPSGSLYSFCNRGIAQNFLKRFRSTGFVVGESALNQIIEVARIKSGFKLRFARRNIPFVGLCCTCGHVFQLNIT